MDHPPDLTKAGVIADACAALSNNDPSHASAILRAGYPFVPTTKVARRYTERESLRVFYRDGFIDRYSGTQLVHPGALRLLSILLPEDFPAHPNWDMSKSHFGFYELFPSIDHLVPVARGGVDDDSNWVTTSMLRNSAKAHWTLEELDWPLLPAGDIAVWDGWQIGTSTTLLTVHSSARNTRTYDGGSLRQSQCSQNCSDQTAPSRISEPHQP